MADVGVRAVIEPADRTAWRAGCSSLAVIARSSRTALRSSAPVPLKVSGATGAAIIAESCEGSLSSARPLADSDRLCCGGPALPAAGIRAACRREGGRPAAQPVRTARRRTHAQDTVNPNPGAALGREDVGMLGDRPAGLPGLPGWQQCHGPLVAQVDRRVEPAVGRPAPGAAEGVGSGDRVPPRSRVAVPHDGAVHGYAAGARCMGGSRLVGQPEWG